MKKFPVRQVKQRFSDVMIAAAEEPVALTRYNQRIAIIMTPDHYETLAALARAGKARTFEHLTKEISEGRGRRADARRLLGALRAGLNEAGRHSE